jgi:glycerol-3-phosphate dehydrogenase (NAD(P)+)
MTRQVTVIGDGQFGLVLASLAAARGHGVRLWGAFPDELAKLAATRTSPRLPGFELDPAVQLEPDAARALAGAELCISAVPTQHLAAVWSTVGRELPAGTVVVSVSKGLERGSLRRPSQIVKDAVPGHEVVTMSGPSIAAEMARRLPLVMVVAGAPGATAPVQDALSCSWLRLYTLRDHVGVELAGAAKNVIALAAGMLDGMRAGMNAKSALLARGLAEIVRFGSAHGAQPETFFGVAGVGDLATTCFSLDGRNRSCGEALGRGQSLQDHLAGTRSVVEGVDTCDAIVRDARARGIELPIMEAVHGVLFGGIAPAQALHSLMTREVGVERVR